MQSDKPEKKTRKNSQKKNNGVNKTLDNIIGEPSLKEDNIIDDIEKEEGIKKVKRGRKPKAVYNSTDIVTNTVQVSHSDDENIIVQLNIKDNIIDKDIYEDDEVPYAYNHDYYSVLSSVGGESSNLGIKKAKQDESIKTLKIINVLKDFEEKNKNNEWPANTTIHCYWCCNKFENPPVGIPVNYDKEVFNVYGCFCSLECAAAYNFKMNHNIDEMWERFNLINLMARKLGCDKQIKPAPDRLSLKQFGGFMEIDQFREYTTQSRFVNVNFPPMNSLTQQLEEINDYDLKNDMKYIPIDNDRINKYKEKVLFKRNKPLIDVKNSIESTMNLKYNT